MKTDDAAAVLLRSAPDGDCLIWQGPLDRRGYGLTNVRGKRRSVHRVVYEARVGEIPPGLTVDHLCFRPRCVRPEHLRLLTHAENSRNQRSALKTHCVNGHEFTPENTYMRPERFRGGRRDCEGRMTARVIAAQLAGAVAFAFEFVGRCLIDIARELEQATAPRPMRVPNYVPEAWSEELS